MAVPQLLQDNFQRMIQDLPRDQLPDDAAWYMRDFIPNLGLVGTGNYPGRLSRRGGWLYVSENIATDATSATQITGMRFFDRPNRLCVMTDNNKFGYTSPPNTNFTLVATSGTQSLGHWTELQGTLVIPAAAYGAPLYYDGTTFGTLGGTPPHALYTCTWKDRIVLGSTAAKPNRLYWSALDDPVGASLTPTGWDQTNAWNDMSFDISGGMAPLPNALLVFGSDLTARIRGSIPPPGSDFIVDDPVFRVGCHYPKSVAVNNSICIFCNEEGVWLTNGTSQPQDLTSMCGVKNTWQNVITQTTRIGTAGIGTGISQVCGGFIGNYYLATITRLEGDPPIAFLFDLANRTCVTISNFSAECVAMTPQVGDELYFGLDDSARVIATSPIFQGGGDKIDEDGTVIAPYLYTRYYGDNRTNFKRWKHAYLDYYMRDAASDNPSLTVSFDPSEYGNESLGGETFAKILLSTESGVPAKRAKIPLNHLSRGMSFKIEQDNASAVTNIIALLATVQAQEGGRV